MHSDKAVSKRLYKRYEKQSARGNEGYGFVAFTDTKVKVYERFQTENEVKAALKKNSDTHVLFHHRYPTSTENVVEAAHPIKVEHSELQYTYYVVHNGIISNPKSLKTAHEKLGYSYETELRTQYVTKNGTVYSGDVAFNDSEALAIELCRNIEKGTAVAAEGSAAFIVLQVSKNGKKAHKLYYGTNGGNPLTVDRNGTSLCIASEGGALKVASMSWHILDLHTNELATAPLDMKEYKVTTYAMGYGAYSPHYNYMPLENDEEEDTKTAPAYSTRTITELEKSIAEIEADIAIAKQVGDEIEIQDLEIEKEAIEQELLEEYDAITYGYSSARF